VIALFNKQISNLASFSFSSENIMKFAAKIEEAPEFFRQLLNEVRKHNERRYFSILPFNICFQQTPESLKQYTELLTNKCEEVKSAWLARVNNLIPFIYKINLL
jgi:hypothetical protein